MNLSLGPSALGSAATWPLATLLAFGCGGDATAPAPVIRLVIVAGNNQHASVCAAVPTAPAVRVEQNGNPLSGVAVKYTVGPGSGSVTGANATTDAAGIATVGSWVLGVDTGSYALTATVSSGGGGGGGSAAAYATFTATGHAETILRNVIIYTTEEFGFPDVALVRPDGSCRRRLTRGDAPYGAPTIAPDGRRIAVARRTGTWNGIWVMNSDASGLTKVVGHSDFDGSPAWSPDGGKLAFRSENPGPYGPYGRIYVVNVDGTGLRQLTPETATYTFDDGPTWSPDGTQLAFSRNGRLFVINADGTGLMALPSGGEYPAWSPDGAHIAYGTSGGTWSIFIVNADGTNPVALTTDTAQKDMPRWSPDSRSLVFQRVINATFQLFTIHADGSGEHKLSATAASDSWPNWSPLP
jgi:hypothetical protein